VLEFLVAEANAPVLEEQRHMAPHYEFELRKEDGFARGLFIRKDVTAREAG
jgi:hypothetical protein